MTDNSFPLNEIKLNEMSVTSVQTKGEISMVRFNKTGKFLAVGYDTGDITMYKYLNNNTFSYFCNFEGYQSSFDQLKSTVIEPKINGICWLKQPNVNHFILTSNERSIKLWKISEDASEKRIKERRLFSEGHIFKINSISTNCDMETFLSADDLRVNMWNQEVSNKSFNIVDLKPANLEDVNEVITCATFHPFSTSTFIYSSSAGIIRLCDMRRNVLCDRHAKIFGKNTSESKNIGLMNQLFLDITDVKFSNDARLILARNPLKVKIWDVAYEKAPLAVYNVDDSLYSKSILLYEKYYFIDRFEILTTRDDSFILTGTYGDSFKIFGRPNTAFENINGIKYNISGDSSSDNSNLFDRKIMHFDCHPYENIIAMGINDRIMIYRYID